MGLLLENLGQIEFEVCIYSADDALWYGRGLETDQICSLQNSKLFYSVAVRLRPLNKDEMITKKKKKGDTSKEQFTAWSVDVDDELDYIMEKRVRTKKEGHNIFHVDRVYEETDHSEALYVDMVAPIMQGALSGRHGTVFAFGPTSTGKSYTIQGGSGAEGMIQMACKELFDRIGRDNQREYTVKAGYFEVYNEQVRDLMGQDEADQGPKSRRATACVTTVNKTNVELPICTVREDPKTGETYVDAAFQKVSNVENVIRVLHKGNRNRATEKTEQNQFSSRSHAIFRIIVESHEKMDEEAADDMDEGIAILKAAVNFVDLAGSENSLRAATKGARKAEGGKINQRYVPFMQYDTLCCEKNFVHSLYFSLFRPFACSLLALSQVINQLSLPPKKQPKYINYRDSQLTRILKPHLSGNAIMSIICCASPSKKFLEETRQTLKFAYNAKRIKLKPQVNEVIDDRALIESLRRELQEARMKIYDYEQRMKEMSVVPEGMTLIPIESLNKDGTIKRSICGGKGAPGSGEGGGDSEYPMLERFMAQMNQSVATDAFFDAASEMQGSEKNLGEELSATGGGSEGNPTEDDEAEIERMRQEILAKFMNDITDDDFPDEDEGDVGDDHEHEPVNDTVDQTADQTMEETRDTTIEDTGIRQTYTDETIEAEETVKEEVEAEETVKEEAPAPTPAPEEKAVFRSKPEEPQKVETEVEVKLQEDSKASKEELVVQKKKSFLDDESSNDMLNEPIKESDLDLIERFREEILDKFRDEIVDEEAAHELDENAQNVAVIANELINKFKKEIVYKYKDEFPELLVKRITDIAATRVGDSGIVGRVIERDANASSEGNLATTDDDSDVDEDEQEHFEDEFDEDANFDTKKPTARGEVLHRTYSQQTDRAIINGKPSKEHGSETPIHSSLGRGTSGSVSSDLSSDVANNKGGSTGSPLAASPPDEDYEDDQIPFGEIAISKDGAPILDDKMKIRFLQEKLTATDELVESLFVELDNAKAFIRELVFENAGGGNQAGSSLFGPAGTSGVTVVDEVILKQCEILKFAIYVSLLFFVFGQHELFLATVFFLWLSLEVATKA